MANNQLSGVAPAAGAGISITGIALSQFSLDEVSQHVKKDDLWLAIHNHVYDVTSYLHDHPGGVDVLLQYAGQDSSEIFESVGHSDDARARMEKLLIGELNSESQIEEEEPFHKVYPDTHNPDRRALGAGTFVTAGGVLSGFVYVIGKRASRTDWHRVQRWFTTAGSSREQFVKGILVSSILASTVVAWATPRVLKYLMPSAAQGHYNSFRKMPYSTRSTDLTVPKRSADKSPLDAKKFKNFQLLEKVQLSDGAYRFVFSLGSKEQRLAIPIGQHVTLEANIDGKTVSRSYTPASSPSRTGTFDLVVKVYPNGKMGTHLSQLDAGAQVTIRGPKGAMKYHSGWASTILMIAGGSGITPMFQLLLSICEDESDKTKVKLLYGNNTEDDIILRQELEDLASDHPEKLEVVHVLSHPSDEWTGEKGWIGKEIIAQYAVKPEKSEHKVLLCGPPPMQDAVKTALTEVGYKEPPAMSTMDDQVFVF